MEEKRLEVERMRNEGSKFGDRIGKMLSCRDYDSEYATYLVPSRHPDPDPSA